MRRWLPMVAALVVLLECPNRAQQFSSRIEAVRVDVLVTDGSKPVLGLGREDFEILDNGVPQAVDLVSFDEVPLNVILALDMSDSVAGERLDRLRDGGSKVLAALKSGDQAALVTFSHAVQLGARLTSDVASVQAALAETGGSGQTALIDGSYAGIMVGESDAGRALLIVFSDGVDTSSWLRADAVLDTARRADVVVYGVSVVSRLKPEFLREITSLTGGRLFEIEKATNLAATFLSILEEFRHRYLVSYTPKGVSRDGWHKLDVRVKNRRTTIKARPGYLAGDAAR
ncbi:MAG TPA: VWA domain-containing protein [Vicinamibacterales bacterium]|nr:VWA domain-containing protein [Vicinamibacterales bacterium]